MMDWKRLILLFLLPAVLTGCTAYKDSLYLRDDQVLDLLEQKERHYVYRIMPKDELTIVVSTSDPASSVPFYRKIGQAKGQQATTQGMDNARLLNYLVDNEGYIDYPVLGKLHVSGLSTRECEDLIRGKLEAYLNEVPNVTVRTLSYKISVLGEVNAPGTYSVSDEHINIFQALAQAGDMTLLSDRTDVQLLREDAAGKCRVYHLDLTKADIALSPYYQLQQNDIVYVKPTKAKVRSTSFNANSSMWISLLSMAASVASLVVIVLK